MRQNIQQIMAYKSMGYTSQPTESNCRLTPSAAFAQTVRVYSRDKDAALHEWQQCSCLYMCQGA